MPSSNLRGDGKFNRPASDWLANANTVSLEYHCWIPLKTPPSALLADEDKAMKYVFCILIVILFVLHQDYWQWKRTEIVLGFIPYTLLYHVVISLATAALWFLVVQFCWPRDLDQIETADRKVKEAKSEQP